MLIVNDLETAWFLYLPENIIKDFESCDSNNLVHFSTGIQLKDLIAVHTVLPDTVDGHLLNLQKMVRLSKVMSRLLLAQNTVPPVQPNSELIKMLRVRLNYVDLILDKMKQNQVCG